MHYKEPVKGAVMLEGEGMEKVGMPLAVLSRWLAMQGAAGSETRCCPVPRKTSLSRS